VLAWLFKHGTSSWLNGATRCGCWSPQHYPAATSFALCGEFPSLLKVRDLRAPLGILDAVAHGRRGADSRRPALSTARGSPIRRPAARHGAGAYATPSINPLGPRASEAGARCLDARPSPRSRAAWTDGFVVSTADRQYRSSWWFGAPMASARRLDRTTGACFAAKAQSVRCRKPHYRGHHNVRRWSCTPSRGGIERSQRLNQA